MSRNRRLWTGIVVHHSKGADHVTRMSFDEIRKFHTDPAPPAGTGRGWSDVAYHFIVEHVEGSFVAIVGRPLDHEGSHAPPRNFDTIGVCCVGDFDLAPPDPALLTFAARYVIAPLINLFEMEFPACLLAHKDVTPGRQCPGKKFDMVALRAAVSARLGV